ncbi:hypothetical protein TELCIR_21130, partial [Teladorsagia circumcincta]
WNAQDVVQEYSVDEFILGMVSQLFDNLSTLYDGDIDSLDAFVGGVLEVDNEPGELFKAILKEQFNRLRNSDRFWFENKLNGLFTSEEIERIHGITLGDMIRETMGISEQWLQKNVFVFGDGDPCPQPFQVNTTGLESCTPLMRFDHVTEVEGNEITFIFTLIGLGCIPL